MTNPPGQFTKSIIERLDERAKQFHAESKSVFKRLP